MMNQFQETWFFSHEAEIGKKLAETHKAGKSSKGFGFEVDNTICRWNTDSILKSNFPLLTFESMFYQKG